jgi:hypothetical protein
MGPGTPTKVQLLFNGKPLPNWCVSFVPRGEKLAEGFDERFERKTDAEGKASFSPTAGNYFLVVARWEDADAARPNFRSTKYPLRLTSTYHKDAHVVSKEGVRQCESTA